MRQMKENGPIKLAARLCAGLVLLLLAAACLSSARAVDKRLVKVAFFPMEGYHEKKQDGSLTGMDVEYLDSLRRYVDWNIEFVECGSWDEALQMLSERKVDLVGSAQYSAARAESYQYADLSSGYTFGIIATKGDSGLAYEDFEAMEHVTFGMVKTYVRRAEFIDYMQDHGVMSPRIREYDSSEELQQALEEGEIDAWVHTFMEVREGQRIIGRFAPRPFYYISYPGNDEVMRELNHAVADVKMNEPTLETELINKYYQSRLDKTIVFTTREKEYIQNTDTVKVGYFDGYYPFVYEERGDCAGLTREMLESTAGLVGLNLEWKRITSPDHASQSLRDGEIDVMSYCIHTEEEAGSNELIKLAEYTQVPLLLVMEKNKESSNIQTLAVVEYLNQEAGRVADLDDIQVIIYDT